MNDTNPDYVVVGETRNYNYERLERAVHLVRNGAKLIGTNPDLTDIIAGIESEIETVLVLSGVTSREDLHRFAYRPRYILGGRWRYRAVTRALARQVRAHGSTI